MKDTTAKRILSTVLSVSLTVSAAGCNHAAAETTQADSQTTTTAATTEAAATEESSTEAATEAPSTTASAVLTAENGGRYYQPGDYITFGKYEQDNKKSNGKEDIEWIILDRQGDKFLLISRMALDQQPYNTKKADVTWETSSLRKWLNGSFYDSAFDKEDKAQIIKTNVTADKNPEFDTSPGNDTKDNVFLLSITEFHKYFASIKGIVAEGTEYAKAKEKNTASQVFVWWLRTPGNTKKHASMVIYYGPNDNPVTNYGLFVNRTRGCSPDDRSSGVRPVIWVDLADYPKTPDKHIYSWIEGYGTARINYDDPSKDDQVQVEIPNIPCRILYVDGFPAENGKVRPSFGTDEAIREWLDNNGAKNSGYGWYNDVLIKPGSGHLEKTK